ncbi:methyltransferase domain-containing protein [Patescibacteria group bacterium]|nr:methyltransferase domain-containing protein [Patescibacteria group bacterium]
MKPKARTSWGDVSEWYDTLLEETPGTYQKEVILPELLRLMELNSGTVVADIACGQGFFSRAFAQKSARVVAADIAPELIAAAKQNTPPSLQKRIRYEVSPADHLAAISTHSTDVATIILAIQNIENVNGVLGEAARILKQNGRLFIVMNHPAFRIPKESAWGWDPKTQTQYRRLDRYISESKVKIQMHPGDKPEEHTISFHRPLQFYAKALRKHGFLISHMEEWTSHKQSQPGPRAAAEDRARKEFPLFLCIEAIRHV